MTVPNLKVCSVAGQLSAGMECAETITGQTSSLDLDGTIGFLEPTAEHAGALCMSSDDYARMKTALEQLCEKSKACTPEVKAKLAEMTERLDGIQARRRK